MPVACELKIVAATIKITAITAIPYSIANPCRINRFIAFVLLPERILDEPNHPSRKRRTNLNVIFLSLHLPPKWGYDASAYDSVIALLLLFRHE